MKKLTISRSTTNFQQSHSHTIKEHFTQVRPFKTMTKLIQVVLEILHFNPVTDIK
jgi:hypothetical protein